MILHIFNKQEKFSIQYIKFLRDFDVDLSKHMFFHYGKSSGFFEKEGMQSIFSSFTSIKKHLKLYQEMKKADKIIVHSLASPFLLLLLMFKIDVSKKFYWIIWGKDLYFTQCVNMRNPIMIIYEVIRKLAIKNVKHIITNIEADYELAKKWYHAEAELIYVEGMSYPYNSDETKEFQVINKSSLQLILVGNSASMSNNHLEALAHIKEQDDGKIEIICPLSYGGKKKYVNQVLQKGKALFGERFHPLIDFMPLDKYNQILKKVDVAFFNHKRQEAFSNTLTLMSMGKKIYIRPESTLWDYFQKKGIAVHNSCDLEDVLQVPESMEVLQNNHEQVKKIRDLQVSLKGWKCIFDEI